MGKPSKKARKKAKKKARKRYMIFREILDVVAVITGIISVIYTMLKG